MLWIKQRKKTRLLPQRAGGRGMVAGTAGLAASSEVAGAAGHGGRRGQPGASGRGRAWRKVADDGTAPGKRTRKIEQTVFSL